jgi:hypothetical protein
MNDGAGKPVVLDYRGPAETTAGWPAVYRPYQTEFLLIRAGADLPPRCLKCNRQAEGKPIRVRLSWIDPGDRDGYRGTTYGPVTLIVWIGFVIEGLFKRRMVISQVSLCRRHRVLRWVKFIAWLLSPLALVLIVQFGIAHRSATLAMAAVIGLLAWFLTFHYRPRLLRVVGMEKGYYITIGAGAAFLRSLRTS